MAQAGSAYNLHERHKENHVKIGNCCRFPIKWPLFSVENPSKFTPFG